MNLFAELDLGGHIEEVITEFSFIFLLCRILDEGVPTPKNPIGNHYRNLLDRIHIKSGNFFFEFVHIKNGTLGICGTIFD